MIYVVGFTPLKEEKYYCRFELFGGRWSILIIAAYHAYCIILSYFEVMSWSYGPTVPVQISIVRCPRRGTMRLHILRGMKAKVACIACICIHWSYCRCYIRSELVIQSGIVVREEMIFDIFQLLNSLSWSISLINCGSPLNWWLLQLVVQIACQNTLLAEIFYLTLALLNAGTWWLSRGHMIIRLSIIHNW